MGIINYGTKIAVSEHESLILNILRHICANCFSAVSGNVTPNNMRSNIPVKGQNKVLPSIDTKNLATILGAIKKKKSLIAFDYTKLITAVQNSTL